jgi:hypothetical protein
VRITVANRGPDAARLDVLPTLWFRNTWSWGRVGEGYWPKGKISRVSDGVVEVEHASLERMRLWAEAAGGVAPELLFTENETNCERLFDAPSATPYVKDAFHTFVVGGRRDAVNPAGFGTKVGAHYRLGVPARSRVVLRARLASVDEAPRKPFGPDFERLFDERIREADAFYAGRAPATLATSELQVVRQGYAGLLWSKQYYHYVVRDWLDGDPAQPPPPPARREGRNHDWLHLYNRDVISMPDKWEYPWYAAWDLAFHMIPFANVDPHFAKEQLVLMSREWYTHPNGQTPAYEWAFGDVNPPVSAWAAWRIYKMTGQRGARDRLFLSRIFQKHLLNFTWWVNRKDVEGKNLFSGGFLGLDNIGVFDRSRPLPTGGHLEQADGTAWMAFYCTTMMSMAIELARDNPACEDLASKFFEHFVSIVDAMNSFGGHGLWDDQDGFYYDQLHLDHASIPLRVRSMVGIIPLFAAENLEADVLDNLPGFAKRLRWFIENRQDLARYISYFESPGDQGHGHRLLAIPSRDRLERVLKYVLDEREFLSPYGIRSLALPPGAPLRPGCRGEEHRVEYTPGESTTGLFGGNSNWRGPIWMPLNYLLVEALERYHHFYGDTLKVECPTGSGRLMNLSEVARELARRLTNLFLPDASGRRPCHGDDPRFRDDPAWKDLILFHEYFHGDTGRGVGASHQTGWTALAVRGIEYLARREAQDAEAKPARANADPPPLSRVGQTG